MPSLLIQKHQTGGWQLKKSVNFSHPILRLRRMRLGRRNDEIDWSKNDKPWLALITAEISHIRFEMTNSGWFGL